MPFDAEDVKRWGRERLAREGISFASCNGYQHATFAFRGEG
jgi:hypothetical protein